MVLTREAMTGEVHSPVPAQLHHHPGNARFSSLDACGCCGILDTLADIVQFCANGTKSPLVGSLRLTNSDETRFNRVRGSGELCRLARRNALRVDEIWRSASFTRPDLYGAAKERTRRWDTTKRAIGKDIDILFEGNQQWGKSPGPRVRAR